MITDTDLSLKVWEDHPLTNRCVNPNGALGGYGWSSDTPGSIVASSTSGPQALVFSNPSATGAQTWRSDQIPVLGASGGEPTAWLTVLSASRAYQLGWIVYDHEGAVVGTHLMLAVTAHSAPITYDALTLTSTGGSTVNVASYRFIIKMTTSNVADKIVVNDVLQLLATGPVTRADEQPPTATDITPWVGALSVSRKALDVGTLGFTVESDTLSLTTSNTLAPSRRVTLDVGGERVFTGRIDRVDEVRNKPKDGPTAEAVVNVSCVDAWAHLAQTPERRSVAALSALPHIFEGKGVPWIVEGSRDHVTTPTTLVGVAGTMADQCALARDSFGARVFIDRHGQLVVSTTNVFPGWVASDDVNETFDVHSYVDLELALATDELINAVTIVRHNATSGGAYTTTTHGPYTRPDSIRTWGRRSATFEVVKAGVTPATMATAILDANATPALRPRSATFTADTVADLVRLAQIEPTGVLGVIQGTAWTPRIDTVTHTATASTSPLRPVQWLTTVTFHGGATVAVPK